MGVAHTPLRDQIREHVRTRITRGEFAPGSKLVERELAAELGVSRVPVREALRMLETEGLVQVVPRRGVIVKELTHTDIEELFDVREALESMTAKRAAERAKTADLRRLRRHLDRAQRAAGAGKLDAFGDANLAFHDEIAVIAENNLLRTILEPLRSRLDWLFRQPDDPDRLYAEHDSLYQAIASGDPERAGEMARDHVQSSRVNALRILCAGEPTATVDSAPGKEARS
ncbi:GntR family transcriptional regulator [Streptomyces hainanensis]|uniref:GntR family transcriptional regulator n=2 Tax=Streptomyces hainanensis TaxID=402648 RepID=A0A4R4TIP1_9ACTN|nr:GntR family transcriptional regulator [Streptomyces hainanensis]